MGDFPSIAEKEHVLLGKFVECLPESLWQQDLTLTQEVMDTLKQRLTHSQGKQEVITLIECCSRLANTTLLKGVHRSTNLSKLVHFENLDSLNIVLKKLHTHGLLTHECGQAHLYLVLESSKIEGISAAFRNLDVKDQLKQLSNNEIAEIYLTILQHPFPEEVSFSIQILADNDKLHENLSRLLNSDCPYKEARKLMGHSSPTPINVAPKQHGLFPPNKQSTDKISPPPKRPRFT